MVYICVSIVLIIAMICFTICYIYREKTYQSGNGAEGALLENVYYIANNAYQRIRDRYEPAMYEDKKVLIDCKSIANALLDIISITSDYDKT